MKDPKKEWEKCLKRYVNGARESARSLLRASGKNLPGIAGELVMLGQDYQQLLAAGEVLGRGPGEVDDALMEALAEEPPKRNA